MGVNHLPLYEEISIPCVILPGPKLESREIKAFGGYQSVQGQLELSNNRVACGLAHGGL